MSKRKMKIAVCLTILVVSMVFSGTAFAREARTPMLDDEVVLFGTYRLESGDTLSGSLVVFGGVVTLEEGSVVDGDVVVFGGNVTVDGVITGGLVGIGGVVSLTETAEVRGDLIAPATVVRRDEGAKIFGQIITENVPRVNIELPEDVPSIPEITQPSFTNNVSRALQPVLSFFTTLARALVFSAVSVLALLLMPKNGKRVRTALEGNPGLSGGFGLLSVAVFVTAVVMLALLSITVILIPVTIPMIIVLSLALALSLLFGLMAAGAEVGRRMMNALKQTWSPTLQIAIGSFSLSFVLGLLSIGLWGVLGGLMTAVVSAMGLGAVLLTRFGTRDYVPAAKSSTKAKPADEDSFPELEHPLGEPLEEPESQDATGEEEAAE